MISPNATTVVLLTDGCEVLIKLDFPPYNYHFYWVSLYSFWYRNYTHTCTCIYTYTYIFITSYAQASERRLMHTIPKTLLHLNTKSIQQTNVSFKQLNPELCITSSVEEIAVLHKVLISVARWIKIKNHTKWKRKIIFWTFFVVFLYCFCKVKCFVYLYEI